MANKVNWGDVLNSVGTVKTGQFLFPKGPRTKIRFLQHPDDQTPFRTVQSEYQGTVREKYLILGYSPDELKLKGVILPVTAFRSLVTYLAEDYDFFDPQKGHAVIIAKDSQGNRTTYNVVVSKGPMPADSEVLESMGDQNLDYFVKEWDEWQNRRTGKSQAQTSQTSEEEEEDPWS